MKSERIGIKINKAQLIELETQMSKADRDRGIISSRENAFKAKLTDAE